MVIGVERVRRNIESEFVMDDRRKECKIQKRGARGTDTCRGIQIKDAEVLAVDPVDQLEKTRRVGRRLVQDVDIKVSEKDERRGV